MNYWIFQSITERFDLREELQEGEEETWLVSRYWQHMSPGDLVFFWLGGPATIRGIYGWGTLITSPQSDGEQYGARVRCDRKLTAYLSIDKIREVAMLNDISVLRAPQGSNFMLAREEAQAIANLIDPAEKSPIPPIPAELVDFIRAKECVLFAGAGLS